MTEIQSIVLGVVEGLTEFLPVSSTGHLILTSRMLDIADSEFVKSFNIIIQFGAILSVLVLYWREFIEKNHLKKIITASIPTAIIGFGFYQIIKNSLLESSGVVLWALLLGGIFLIIFELSYKGPDVAKEDVGEITYKQAFMIGVFQSLAIIPGVSRSAATIIGGLSLGIPRPTIVKFSFLLAVPVLLGASLLDVTQVPKSVFEGNMKFLIIGFVVSFIVAMMAIKFFMHYVRRKNFIPFGIYRILIALAFFFIIF